MTVLQTPFRLGSTSYIWPDDILPNVRRLGPWVDDVELVLFEVDEYNNLPDAATLDELNELAERHDLTYTVHLPLDLALAHAPSMEKALKVIALGRHLAPRAYVLHLDGRAVEGEPNAGLRTRWQEDALRVLDQLGEAVGDPSRLCVENLENYCPEEFLPLLDRIPVSLCVDVGHLWLMGRDPVSFLEEHLDRTRVIHLHGIGERDHQSLLYQDREQVAPVVELLSERSYEGVVTLEVFSREDFFPSRSLVAELVNGHH